MPASTLHTIHKDGEWLNELEGEPVVSRHRTKHEAVEVGRVRAEELGAEHVVHNMDGTIGDRSSLGAGSLAWPH